jgi:hypothetical protein
MRRVTISVFAALLFFSASARAEGLDTLIEIARSQGDIQEEYAGETKSFEQVKRAVDNGAIKKGQSKDEVMSRYGEPVVALQEDGREKWIYKPAKSSFFEGARISLFFDKDGLLDEIRVDN